MRVAKTAINILLYFLLLDNASAQLDTTKQSRQYKNVIRYNLSGAILFGIDHYIVLGYERLLLPNQSFSVNFGKASLPRLVSITTDSFALSQDLKNTGTNFSVDYRFYLKKENKYLPPHGLYIGPFYSFNHFKRENRWDYKTGGSNNHIITNSKFDIHTLGFELGYQLVLWKRWTLDLLMIGPGFGFYKYNAVFDGNLDPAMRDQLLEGLKQLLTQRFPGMNYVFSEEHFDARGTMNVTALGYRYIIQFGFSF